MILKNNIVFIFCLFFLLASAPTHAEGRLRRVIDYMVDVYGGALSLVIGVSTCLWAIDKLSHMLGNAPDGYAIAPWGIEPF